MFKAVRLPYLSLGITVCWLFVMLAANEIPPDTGDGIMHFFISQASWKNPLLLLDHWGKPLFILVSSPFAQFGFKGIILFQILVYFLTCIVAFRLLKKMKVADFLIAIFPFFLLLTNDYTTTILSALTEPLFNLVLVVGLLLLVEKKWLFFALTLSFTPFLRSEGQLCILIGLVLLALHKQYRYLPFLFAGFLIYSSIGWFVFDDFWWYFTKSPYHLSNNIYGKGTWYHYLLSYKNYLGNHGLLLLVLAILVFFYKKLYLRLHKENVSFYLFSTAIFFGVLLAHSYFWASGQNGSYGLTRIATQGMPVVVIAGLFTVNEIRVPWKKSLLTALKFFAFFLLCTALFSNKKWPVKAKGMNAQMIRCSTYLQNNANKKGHIFYHHPLLPFEMKNNPFLADQQLKLYYGQQIERELGEYIKPGDLLVWDSYFGDLEAGIPLQKLMGLPHLTLVKEFKFQEQNGTPEGIYVFQYQEEKKIPGTQTFSITPYKKNYTNKNEFNNIQRLNPDKDGALKASVFAKYPGSFLVCADSDLTNYQVYDLAPGDQTLHFSLQRDKTYKLYFWNPKKRANSYRIDSILVDNKIFPDLLH